MSWLDRVVVIALVCAACNSGDDPEPPAPVSSVPPARSPEPADAGEGAQDAVTDSGDTSAEASADAAAPADAAPTETDQCPDAAAVGQWSDLYRCYFGTTGIANCGQSDGCHQTSAGSGSESSGFVCGQTADSCWQGMTSSSIPSRFDAIVPTDGGPSDVTRVILWSVLRKTSGQGLSEMPYTPTTVVFTSPDMARIAAWIQRGAPKD